MWSLIGDFVKILQNLFIWDHFEAWIIAFLKKKNPKMEFWAAQFKMKINLTSFKSVVAQFGQINVRGKTMEEGVFAPYPLSTKNHHWGQDGKILVQILGIKVSDSDWFRNAIPQTPLSFSGDVRFTRWNFKLLSTLAIFLRWRHCYQSMKCQSC